MFFVNCSVLWWGMKKATLKNAILFVFSVAVLGFHSSCLAVVQRIVFVADVVASVCHVVVEADSTGNSGRLTFGTYRKSTGGASRDFTVHLYESGATVQGCSAFKAGRVATLDFGNPGQLDAGGVVTRGAGDGIRVDVRAVDTQADYRGRLTQDSHSVNYPVDFAAKGQFRFRALPVFPADVKAGEYTGALTFVVTYQ